MSDRLAYLYQPADKFDPLALLDGWASSGVLLKNPASGRSTLLSQDGEQVDMSVQELVAAVSSHVDLTFQLWVSSDTDLCCRIRFLNDSRLVEEYSLVGLGERMNEIVGTLLERFKAKAAECNNLFSHAMLRRLPTGGSHYQYLSSASSAGVIVARIRQVRR